MVVFSQPLTFSVFWIASDYPINRCLMEGKDRGTDGRREGILRGVFDNCLVLFHNHKLNSANQLDLEGVRKT